MMNMNPPHTGPGHSAKRDGSDSAQGLPEPCVVPLPPGRAPLCALLLLPPEELRVSLHRAVCLSPPLQVSLCHVLSHRLPSVQLSPPALQSVSPLQQVGGP